MLAQAQALGEQAVAAQANANAIAAQANANAIAAQANANAIAALQAALAHLPPSNLAAGG